MAYYRELYEKDRESKIDSLKELRPKYKTKSGRTVYGGGGITPDVYIPYKNKINLETNKIIRNAKRPIFNFASRFSSEEKNTFNSFSSFKENWFVNDSLFNSFLDNLAQDSIYVDLDSILIDHEYIKTTIKSEIAGSIWGKDEATNIRLELDNQVIEALKHFNEADAFLD